jgi:hypothetical protein
MTDEDRNTNPISKSRSTAGREGKGIMHSTSIPLKLYIRHLLFHFAAATGMTTVQDKVTPTGHLINLIVVLKDHSV